MNIRPGIMLAVALGLLSAIGSAAAEPTPQMDWIARAGEIVHQDPAWKDWSTTEHQRLKAWTAKPHDDVDWRGGWPHDHVDKATGRFLQWTPDSTMPQGDEKVRAGWVAITRQYNIKQLPLAARMSRMMQDPALADWVRAQLSMYAQAYQKQNRISVGREHAVLFQESLEEAFVLPSLIEAITLVRSGTDAETVSLWETALVAPMVANLMASQPTDISNKTLWRTASIGVASFEFPHPEWDRYVAESAWSLTSMLDKGLSPDGYWYELSLGYQESICGALVNYVLAARQRGKDASGLPKTIGDRVQAMYEGLWQFRLPNKDVFLINDAAPKPVPTPENEWGFAYALGRSVSMDADQVGAISWQSLLAKASGVPSPKPDASARPAQGVRQIDGMKTALLDTQGWLAALRLGQKAMFHAQQDALSMELARGGTWVFRNAGVSSYGAPVYREYFKLGLSHNSVLVGNFPTWAAGADASAVTPTSMSGTVQKFMRSASVVRKLGVEGEAFIDEVQMRSRWQGPQALGAIYHTPCELLPPKSAAEGGADKVVPAGFKYLTERASWKLTGNAESEAIVLNCGDEKFRVSFESPTPGVAAIGDEPNTTSTKRRFLFVRLDPGAEATLRTVVRPLKP